MATSQELSEWRRKVVSRIEEEKEILRSLDEMLLEADDENIPFLRDAYIDFFPIEGAELSERARKLGDELFIDLQDNCCSKTNRVAQGVETLQQLIWKTHTNDVLSHYPGIKLHVEDFDSVWQWMGTYANWRASMFMFLYPENLLLPSLRAIATPGFRAVLETTQNNRRFNPEDACRVAIDYRTYLSDIKSLDVKCSAEIEMIVQKEDVCAGLSQMRKDLVFVFATAANSGRTYFTAVSDSEFGFDQMRNWTRIENLPQNAVIKGCDFYKNGTYGVNHIYLFYLLPGIEERSNFYALRFSLDDNRWEDEPIQFTLEKDRFRIEKTDPLYERPPADLLENMDLTIQELVVCANTHYWQAPTIAINLFSSSESYGVENIVLAFSHSIAAKGIGFGSGDYDYWRCYIRGDVIDPTEYSSSHDPVLESSSTVGYIQNYAFKQGENFDGENYWHDFRFYFHLSDTPNTEEGKKNNIVLVKRNDMLQLVSVAVAPIESFNFLYESDFISFIPTPDKSELFIIYQEGTALKYALIDDFGTNGLSSLVPFFLNPGTKLIQQYTRKGHDPNRINLVTQNALGSNSIRLTSFSYDHATGAVSWGNAFYPTQPQLTEIPGMNPDISSPERQMFGDSGRIATEMNASSDNPRIFDFVEEAYFFLPLEIATSLSQNGYYSEALDWYRLVYDFYAPLDQRKIYYGLVLEEDLESLTDRMDDWYKDPFNPHGIAHTRQNAYTRYVLISIANCLLAYANSEFTFDNSESVPRARELYEDMTDLLSVLAPSNPCEVEEVIRDLSSYIDHDVVWKYLWKDLFDRLNHVDTPMSEFQSLVNKIDEELNDYDTIVDEVQKSQVFKNVETLIDVAMETEGSTMDGILNKHKNHLMTLEGALLSSDKDTPYQTAGRKGAESIGTAMMTITGFSSAELATQNLDWLVEDVPAEVADDRKPDPMDYSKGSQNGRYISLKPWDALEINNPFPHIRISGMPFMFCVVPNPIVAGLRMAAFGNLYKIHNCMNIAGMKRELSPFAAPTDATSGVPSIGVGGSIQVPGQLSIPPSNYRYGYLVERAKQLVTMAAHMESSFMQYLERYDSESFSKLKAQQDLEMAKANIKLQDLKYKEAESHLNLASLQRDRAQIQVDGLQGMIEAGFLSAEQNLVANYMDLGSLQAALATLSAMENATNYLVTAVAGGGLGTPAATALAVVAAKYGFMKSLVQIDVTKLQTEISINSLYASLQRRQQEWEYQKSIAHQDVKIGTQQIKIANDRIRIVGQEREIAELQMTHAEATLDFLKTKFTNAELYEWMSGVLEDVYSYFLQEATATAKLAEQQLSFERQISLPNLIKSDYWSINTNSFSPSIGSGEVDRRGLTGSARLLKDLTELEQYAFDTTQRKLQITKTISLNEYDPIQMEIFRQTGVYNFTLTNNEFDKDYPGHYMRLIRRVGVAVIALVPPVKGIKATLTNSGISSVVTGSVIFQKKTIARMPERIVLSSPYNDYGVFDLQPDQNQYLPFEGSGVETSWELRMEKPANLFDFRSIADVLLTVEYEAMHSEIYANIIKGGLNSRAPGRSIILSVKNDLPDVWYDLQNGVDTDEGFSSQFTIADSDLTPHDVHPKITNCKIFLSHDISEGEEFSFGDNGKLILSLNGSGGQEIDLNTFLVNPTSPQVATGFAEMSPLGEWGIELTNSMQVRELMEVDKLNDILIIINYTVDPIPFAQ
ncbi:MAG TPA: neuraminidase-like domain-containing protein [Sphingobacteriaceae bacterium]|nr:neuraminidase-like domain-containing protein [Sphingobacteriaceae bacterium]